MRNIAAVLFYASVASWGSGVAWGSDGSSEGIVQVVKADLTSRCFAPQMLVPGADSDVWVKAEPLINKRERRSVGRAIHAKLKQLLSLTENQE
jgi:hypothetical protein